MSSLLARRRAGLRSHGEGRGPGRGGRWAAAALAAAVVGCGASPQRASAPAPAPDTASTSARLARPAPLARPATVSRAAVRTASTDASSTSQQASVAARTQAPRPPIVRRSIPFPARRKREMAAYAKRHYGIDDYHLRAPKVIVEHYTESADAQSAINTFAPDVADVELHELPGVCSHFVIDRDGTIYQLVPLALMCRHTVGLNYTAIGIEHAGFSANQILSNAAQMRASLALTRWLECRFGISTANVIGHNESLSSPYHHENVARLRTQTHQDWTRSEMNRYRARLGPRRC